MRTALATVPGVLSLLMSAAMAGTFFGFSVGVMPGLNATPGAASIAAMQGINQRIQNPLFLAAFMLMPVAAAVAGIALWSMDRRAAALLFFAAAAVYVVGAFLPTVAVNVPMNDALARLRIPSDAADAAREWTRYSGRWTAWNHVRALFSTAAVALVAAGFWAYGRGR
ncbi:DUF1772 domain-containing protein [Actinomadura atramentaria]|uniref:anthrone oxygenase family protein n=1 Tax=Actinomadura atramentaria TaxID=1990 RepID=UPI00037A7DD3|nr:anthrone oxygenase family protein [Actinomadura atramentaria]